MCEVGWGSPHAQACLPPQPIAGGNSRHVLPLPRPPLLSLFCLPLCEVGRGGDDDGLQQPAARRGMRGDGDIHA